MSIGPTGHRSRLWWPMLFLPVAVDVVSCDAYWRNERGTRSIVFHGHLFCASHSENHAYILFKLNSYVVNSVANMSFELGK